MFSGNFQEWYSKSFKRVRSFVGNKLGIGIDAPIDDSLNTAIHIAAQKGDEKEVWQLLRRGAYANVANLKNATPLHVAVKYGHSNLIPILVNHGADLEAETSDGFKPIHLVRKCPNKVECLDQLFQNGADINGKDATGKSLLICIVKSRQKDITLFKRLVYWGVDVNTTDSFRNNCLHILARDTQIPYKPTHMLAVFLIDKGIDVNAQNILNETPLHIATTEGHANLIPILLSYGARLDLLDHRQLTPFQIAIDSCRESSQNMMMRHLVIKDHSGHPIEVGLMEKIDSNNDLKFLFQYFEDELNKLKKLKLEDCTMYDVLCGGRDVLQNSNSSPFLSNHLKEPTEFQKEIELTWGKVWYQEALETYVPQLSISDN